MYQFLRATSTTLAEYLRQQLIADPVLGAEFSGGGNMIVSHNNPEEMTENERRGVSVWLYRIVRDDQLLNAPRRRLSDRLHEQRVLPLRLHYLITPIAQIDVQAGPMMEQDLLGKVLQVFHDHPVLRGIDMRDELQGFDLRLHVRLETLSLEEITRVWEALERPYQLCVSYEVSVLPICPAAEPESLAPIREAAPEYSVIVAANGSGGSGGAP